MTEEVLRVMEKANLSPLLFTHFLWWMPDLLQILLQYFFWGFTYGYRRITLSQGRGKEATSFAILSIPEGEEPNSKHKREAIHSAPGLKNLNENAGCGRQTEVA
jgi:hypothetical protein